MKHELDDDHLRQRFARLRDAESASTPRFGVAAARSTGRRNMSWAAAAAALVLSGGAAWLLSQWQTAPNEQFAFDLSGTVWVAPTDFLLNTPGNELLRSVPRIGLNVVSPSAKVSEATRVDTTTTKRRIQ